MSSAVMRAAPQCPERSVALMVEPNPYRAATVGMALSVNSDEAVSSSEYLSMYASRSLTDCGVAR